MRTAACTVRQDSASTAAALLIARHFCFAKGACRGDGRGRTGGNITAVVVLTVSWCVVAAPVQEGWRCLRLSTTLKSTTTRRQRTDWSAGVQAAYNIGKKKPPLISGSSSRVTGVLLEGDNNGNICNWKIADMTVESEPSHLHKTG